MFRMLFVFALAPAMIFAATNVGKCDDGSPTPVVQLQGCDVMPCELAQGTIAVSDITFTVLADTEKLTPKIRATTLGISVNYELPDGQENACANLLDGASCPLKAGDEVTWRLSLPISDSYPTVSVTQRMSLFDDANNIVACYTSNIKIIKG